MNEIETIKNNCAAESAKKKANSCKKKTNKIISVNF